MLRKLATEPTNAAMRLNSDAVLIHQPSNPYTSMSSSSSVTPIRRGHSVYVRATELSKEQRSILDRGVTELSANDGSIMLYVSKSEKGRIYYKARVAEGYKWDDSKTHYPVAVRRVQ